MDRKLISSLNTLSDSITYLIDTLVERETNEKVVLNATNTFSSKNIKTIQKDIQTLKDDNKKILKSNQDILDEIKRNKSTNTPFGNVTNSKNLKDGIKNITLMAGSILALGIAFKIIGDVDFSSVIALSIALPLIALAFEKIGSIKKLTYKDTLSISSVVIAMAGALMVSSWLLYMTAPLNIAQLFTIIGLSAAIAMAMFGIQKILTDKDFSRIKLSDTAKLPVVVVGMATAIVLASYILQGITPLSFNDMLNIIVGSLAISAMALFMSPSFVILSTLLDKVSLGGILKGALSIVLISGAVSVSSYLLSMGDYSNLPSFSSMLALSVGLAILSIPVAVLGAIGLPVILMGSAGLVIMAGALTVASHLLSKMDTEFLYKLSDAFAYFINVIRVPLTAFMKDIIADGIGLLARNVFPVIADMAVRIMPLITDLVDTLGKHLLPFILGVVEKIGDVIKTVSDGIVNIINAITDSIMRLSSLNGANLVMIGAGLVSVSAGLLALTGSSLISGLTDLFGLGIGDTLADIAKYGPMLFMSGKGIDMIASSLERLSKVNDTDYSKLNKSLAAISLSTIDQLSKYNNTVISVNAKDLSSLLKGDNTNISLSPRDNFSNVQERNDSDGKTINDLYDIMQETIQYLSSIANSSLQTASKISSIRPQAAPKKPTVK